MEGKAVNRKYDIKSLNPWAPPHFTSLRPNRGGDSVSHCVLLTQVGSCV